MKRSIEQRYPKLAPLYRAWLNEDSDFKHWISKFDSEATHDNYFRSMVYIYRGTQLRPKDIVARYAAGEKQRQELLDELDTYFTNMKKEGKFTTARLRWATVVSLLIHRGALTNASAFGISEPKSEFIAPQYIPTQEEFELMLRFAGTSRNRFLIAFLRYGGGRRGVVDDPEPIQLSSILDLKFDALKQGRVEFEHASSCAVLLYGSVKNGQIIRYKETYVSFLAPKAMQLMKEYLEERLRAGEHLTPESYLFVWDRTTHNLERCLTSNVLSRVVMNISKQAGFVVPNDKTGEVQAKFTAHSLRRLFYNSITGIDDVDKEALHGHVKGVRARYHRR